MPNRDDENLDVIEGLSAKRDDDLFAGKPGNKAAPSQSKTSREPTGGSTKSGSGGRLSPVVIVVLLALVVTCGWLVWQSTRLQQQLASTESEMTIARKQLDILGAKLSETGDTFSETESVYDKQFKLWESEIRKLWVVANERNKAAIAANKTALGKINSNIQKAVDAAAESEKSNKAIAAQVKRLSSDQSAENTVMKASLEDQGEQLMLLRGEFELLQNRLANVPNDLVQRVKNHEDAIQAIDGARRQFTTDISQLQQRVNELQLSIDRAN